jgi:hypothetical protein
MEVTQLIVCAVLALRLLGQLSQLCLEVFGHICFSSVKCTPSGWRSLPLFAQKVIASAISSSCPGQRIAKRAFNALSLFIENHEQHSRHPAGWHRRLH